MSTRGYLDETELEAYANITVTDATEADERISIAEEMIDAYVGAQDRFFPINAFGVATAATATTITDTSGDTQLLMDNDYYKGCMVEIVGGTGAGQRRVITSSSRTDYRITVGTAFSTTPDTTSAFKIWQVGKFPRHKDVFHDSDTSTPTYYKSIPEAVKRAVAAQVEYMINMGDKYFAGDGSHKRSETIGDYSYTSDVGSLDRLIAPKAKMLLRGIKSRIGRIIR